MTTQESRVFLALGLGFCLLLLASTTAFLASRNLIASSELVDHTHQVRRQLSLLLTTQQDVQTGERGYVITGNLNYLQPYAQARARSDQVYQDLSLLLQDKPEQIARLRNIDELRTQQNRLAEQIIQARQQEGIAAAGQLIGAGEDKHLMDALRVAVAEMNGEQTDFLSLYKDAERQAVTGLNFTLTASTLLALLVAGGGGMIIRHDFKMRRRQEETITEQNRQLEARVEERTAELQESNADLLKFNTNLVDRELRMIELKEEINELCRGRGQPERYDMTSFQEEV